MPTGWHAVLFGAGISVFTAVVTAVVAAALSRWNDRVKWERERQERLDQWQREERQRDRSNRVQVYSQFATLTTKMLNAPIFPERATDFIEQTALFYTVRLIATAPVRDAASALWEALRGYGMSHDPIDGAYRGQIDARLFDQLRIAERHFLIAARKELGIHQEGDIEEFDGLPVA